MKQLSQNKRSGLLRIQDVPPPAVQSGLILVRNSFSVISAGTEKTSIESRKASLVRRAQAQPDEFKKVVDEIKRTGLLKTYRRVMSKLDTSAALGYSTAGTVLDTDEMITDLEPGDRVACAGAEYAYHADVIVVPRNLAVKLPDDVSLESAAYSTLGAIALQGIRQCEPTLGETIVVIGLGLLGQITVQLLKANGCLVIGIDLDRWTMKLAERNGCDVVLHRSEDNVLSTVQSLTRGFGADGVIITAGAKSNDPIELAGQITRERGRVVVVGGVPMDIPRSTYYPKEIDVKLSRSYGPGRYNMLYEKTGLDYPIGYVRWTENRNMLAFIDLIRQGKMNTSLFTTHRFRIDDALRAYDLIEGKSNERYAGIVLEYDPISSTPATVTSSRSATVTEPAGKVERDPMRIGFIGLGSFASGYLMPPLKEIEAVRLDTVCNQSGLTSADMKDKFAFETCATDAEEVFHNDKIGTVFIATRHGLHADFVIKALTKGQNVFVEKPLAISPDELEEIRKAYSSMDDSATRPLLLVGFNRRFAPLIREMKSFFASYKEPKIIHYRVNAGFIPKSNWVHDPFEGGGRIIGEMCHFIDTIQYFTDADPIRLHAESIQSQNEAVTQFDNINVTMRMSDGSLGIITYLANGDVSIPKERIEMHCGNGSAVMDNFSSLVLAQNGKQRKKSGNGDKGHRNEIIAFIDAIKQKKPDVIPIQSLFTTTRATFRILESLRTKSVVAIADPPSGTAKEVPQLSFDLEHDAEVLPDTQLVAGAIE